MKKYSLLILAMLFAGVTYSQSFCTVTPTFSMVPGDPCTINFFTSASGVPPFNFYWDFGDGNSSTQMIPTHTYAGPGPWIVTVTLITGDSCIVSNQLTVNSPNCVGPPTCSASYNYTVSPNDSCTISYTSSVSGVAPYSYFWDFGDGSSSVVANPSHTYSNSGAYGVTLYVTFGDSCFASDYDTVYVSGCNVMSNCQADFWSFPDTLNPCGYYFVDNSSGGGGVLSYFWDFGDGTTSTQQNPFHQYTFSGTYIVTLTITDAAGCTSSSVQTLVVNCGVGTCFADYTWTVSPNDSCTISFVSTVSGTPPYSYSWDFGDGGSSFSANPSHTYSMDGYYGVFLTVFFGDSCVATAYDTVGVFGCNSGVNCSADFWAFPDTINPCGYYFVDNSTGSGGVLSYFWDFGDGTTSNQQNPYHQYSSAGTYIVTLVITDATGCTSTSIQTFVVNCGSGTCFADYTYSYSPNDSCTVSFFSTVTGTPPYTYSWDFGDGNFSSSANPTHTYAASGGYGVLLTVYFGDSCVATAYDTLYISGCNPGNCQADFYVLPDTIDPCTFHFIDNSPGTISGWFWDFGDGNSSTLQFPIHTYSANGSYVVTLTIVDNTGCSSIYTQVVNVTGCGMSNCQASFTYSSTPGNPCTFSFTSSVSGVPPYSYFWDFGDGGTDFSANPNHTYASNGTYLVTLSVFFGDSCIATSVQSLTVTGCGMGNPCTADFFIVPDSTNPCTFYFIDNSSGGVASWFYDFGDGNSSTLSSPGHTYSSNGTYTVSLTIVTLNGCVDTVSQVLTVTGCGPSNCNVTYTYTVSNIPPCPVQFTSNVGGTFPITYNWDFGDGNTSNAANPTHTYAFNSSYGVTLVIVDAAGCTATYYDTVTVNCGNMNPCAANFTYNADPIDPCTYSFTNLSSGWGFDTYFWDFGDGGSSTLPDPTHTYSANGTYTVSMTLVTYSPTGDTCVDTHTEVITLTNCGSTGNCQAGFTHFTSQNDPCMVIFNNTSTGTAPLTYMWDFGDGGSSTFQFPSHSYSANGTYVVTLSLVAGDSCMSSYSDTVVITNCTPVNCMADFSVVQDSNDSYTYHFYDMSTGNPTTWFWSFGDGNTSNLQNPSHTYNSTGTFTVTLIIGGNNCTDTATVTLNVVTSLDASNLVKSIKVYPNPSTGQFQIQAQFEKAISPQIKVFDLTGRMVRQHNEENKRPVLERQLNIEDLSDGIYFLQLESPEGLIYRNKIIKR